MDQMIRITLCWKNSYALYLRLDAASYRNKQTNMGIIELVARQFCQSLCKRFQWKFYTRTRHAISCKHSLPDFSRARGLHRAEKDMWLLVRRGSQAFHQLFGLFNHFFFGYTCRYYRWPLQDSLYPNFEVVKSQCSTNVKRIYHNGIVGR